MTDDGSGAGLDGFLSSLRLAEAFSVRKDLARLWRMTTLWQHPCGNLR